MIVHHEYELTRDCHATLVPQGDEVVLKKGTLVVVTQALGGAITLRNAMGLFRIPSRELDALGAQAVEDLDINLENTVSTDVPFSEELVWEALRNCYDPEIPLNIVDLGLIYDLSIVPLDSGKYNVSVKMTLTAQGCGMGPTIAADAKDKIKNIPHVEEAVVDIVWDPPWNPHMISEEGRKRMGLV